MYFHPKKSGKSFEAVSVIGGYPFMLGFWRSNASLGAQTLDADLFCGNHIQTFFSWWNLMEFDGICTDWK